MTDKTTKNGFKSGFAAIMGRPNAGKSTLLNRLVGAKVAAVSPKPQTTRNNIIGVLTEADYQIVFIDTPGLHVPKNKLGAKMMKSADNAGRDGDVTIYIVEAKPDKPINPADEANLKKLALLKTGLVIAVNKADKFPRPQMLTEIEKYHRAYPNAEIVPLSALNGDNAETLVEAVARFLPVGPPYYPPDTLTDRAEKEIAAEIIREKALVFLQDEIPHGIAVEIEKFEDGRGVEGGIVDITAAVICEKETHKGIIVGKGGEMMKKIGTAARLDLRKQLGCKVMLRLWVKTRKGWRDNERVLKDLGY